MKLKYIIRNFLFPRKHSEEIRTIRTEQLRLKVIEKELNSLENLCRCLIPGDSTIDRIFDLHYAKEDCNNQILKLKQKYKS